MTTIKDLYLEAWDIEGTGQWMQGKDVMFAIGTTTLRVTHGEAGVVLSAVPVESRRWVLNVNPGGKQDWRKLWEERGWEKDCWIQFWSKHVNILNNLMTATPDDMFETEKEMMDSVAKHIKTGEEKYGSGLLRVYDTIGYDADEIGNALMRAGHSPIFLVRQGWPCRSSYLGDIRNAALCHNPMFRRTQAEKDERQKHDKASLPAGISHNHDPASDAACIAWQWLYYYKKGPWFTQAAV